MNSQTCCLILQWFEKRASLAQIAKNWSISYTGNLVGSLFVIKLLALTGLTVAGPAAMKIAAVKTGLTFTEVPFHTFSPAETILTTSLQWTLQMTFHQKFCAWHLAN